MSHPVQEVTRATFYPSRRWSRDGYENSSPHVNRKGAEIESRAGTGRPELVRTWRPPASSSAGPKKTGGDALAAGGNARAQVQGRVSAGMEEALLGVSHAFTVQGPAQALAMLTGLKVVENRAWRIPPGWYALHVGGQRDSEWGQRALEICPDLPAETELQDFFGAIVGLLEITEQRSVAECNGYAWAFGPVCHVVAGAVQLDVPVRHRGYPGLWELTEAVRERLRAQARRSVLVHHDLRVLGPTSAAREDHVWNSPGSFRQDRYREQGAAAKGNGKRSTENRKGKGKPRGPLQPRMSYA